MLALDIETTGSTLEERRAHRPLAVRALQDVVVARCVVQRAPACTMELISI